MACIAELIADDKQARSIELNGVDRLIKYPQEFKRSSVPSNVPILQSPYSSLLDGIANNINNFTTKFFKEFPNLKDLNFSNVLIAGGSISSILTDQHVKDIDFFFYGLSPDDATGKMVDIIEHLNQDDCKLHFVKNKYALTVYIDKQMYQFIFRCYKSISQILHGFDINSSAIGFDGKQLYTTKVGDFAFSAGINIIDLTKRSPTYEVRLTKYFKRGFSIAMPNFNIASIKDKVKLGQLRFGTTPEQVKGCIITTKKLWTCFGHAQSSLTEYADPRVMGTEGPDNHAIEWVNIKAVINNKLDEVIWVGSNLIRLKVCAPTGIIDTYKSIMNVAYDTRHTSINAISLARLNPADDISKIIKWMMNNEEETYKLFVQKRAIDIELTMQNLKYEISWITKNPGAQGLLSSSINPMVTDPKEWYGKHFIECD